MEKIRKGDVVVIHGCGESTDGILGIVTGRHFQLSNETLWKIDVGDKYGDTIYATKYLEVIDYIGAKVIPSEKTFVRGIKRYKANRDKKAIPDYTPSLYDTEIKQNFIFLKDGNKYTAQLFGSRIIIGCGHCNQVVKEINLEDLI
jgi:hypothetical protein